MAGRQQWGRLRSAALRTAAAGLASLLPGCADPVAPAAQRGLFGGIQAWVSGQDEAQARAIEADAARAEQRRRDGEVGLATVRAEAARTAQGVASARERLGTLERRMADDRGRLAALAADARSPAAQAEAARLTQQAEALEAERRRLQGGTRLNPAEVDRLERGEREFRSALDGLLAL